MIIRSNRPSAVLTLLILYLNIFSATASSPTLYTRAPLDTRGDGEDRLKERAKTDYVPHTADDLVCRPFGECEPCPDDEKQQPFCLPFGNRRLLHCIPSASHNSPYDQDSNSQSPGEVPAWEACGKVIKQERHDFWEFVTANVLFLMIALTILWARSSALAKAQYRQLAAKIGIPGGTWRA